jgi:Calcineurin-like phosphoesterase
MNSAPNDWEVDPTTAEKGIGEIADRMDRAAVLMRRDPLRRGNVIHMPSDGDLVIVGDIHGDIENFHRVLDWAALHRNKNRHIVFQEVIHSGASDLLDGDQSYRLLEEVAALKIRYKSQVQMILSNHDLCEILGSTISKAGKNVSGPFWKGIEDAYGSVWPEVHGAYRRFLAALPLAVRTQQGLFISHSTPSGEAMAHFDPTIFERPLTMDDYLTGGSVCHLVWGRNHDQRAADAFAHCVGADLLITGHQTSMPGIKTPTTRHIILTSDGPLGRCLLVRLNVKTPHTILLRQVTKIRSLVPAPERCGCNHRPTSS